MGWWSRCTPRWLGSSPGSWGTRWSQWNLPALLRIVGLLSEHVKMFVFVAARWIISNWISWIAAVFHFLCVHASEASPRAHIHTFALHDVSGAIKVGGGVSRAGDAVVLPKLSLIRARGTADAAVCAGVVVMTWRALDCRSRGQWWKAVSWYNAPNIHCWVKCLHL